MVLSHGQHLLIEMARNAAKNAYCPYSGFSVGAAVETDAGLYTGCNVENASLGLTVCAERVALFSARAAGATKIRRIAVTCPKVKETDPLNSRMPCGACLQVMAELMEPNAEILIDGAGIYTLANLLPSAFVIPTTSNAGR